MQFLYALPFLLALTTVSANTYTTENDDFDIDAAVDNTEKLNTLVDCFLDTVPCSPVGDAFKKDIQEVFSTACAKCTEKQKSLLRKFLEGLKTKLPSKYEAFIKKYDPEGNNFPKLNGAIIA